MARPGLSSPDDDMADILLEAWPPDEFVDFSLDTWKELSNFKDDCAYVDQDTWVNTVTCSMRASGMVDDKPPIAQALALMKFLRVLHKRLFSNKRARTESDRTSMDPDKTNSSDLGTATGLQGPSSRPPQVIVRHLLHFGVYSWVIVMPYMNILSSLGTASEDAI